MSVENDIRTINAFIQRLKVYQDIETNNLVATGKVKLGTVTDGIWNGSVIGTAYGGTGLSYIGSSNQLLGVSTDGSSLEYKDLSSLVIAGDGIHIDGTTKLTISNIGILSIEAGNGISITGDQYITIENKGLLSLNSITGDITLQGTLNQINVDTRENTITLSTPQDIAATSAPVFSGLRLSSLIEGSILFVGANHSISQDNSNLFWDNTNKFLGIGTTSPRAKLEVVGKIYQTGLGNSTFFGYEAGLNDDLSNYNMAIGYQALRSNTTGDYNTALGNYALLSNTTGNSNVAVGGWALYSNTTGGSNIAIGPNALVSNTTGYYNFAIGVDALHSNTTGAGNFAIGPNALYSNTTGESNFAIGLNALVSNTTANSNVAIGRDTLYSNTTGYSNLAIGTNALYANTTGYSNLALGINAGRYISGGGDNTTSNNSIYIGYDTRASANGNTNEIVIGASAVGNGSNSITLGNDSITKTILKGNVGIGTTNPTNFKLQIDGSIGPNTNNAYDLGSTDYKWKNVYISSNMYNSGNTQTSGLYIPTSAVVNNILTCTNATTGKAEWKSVTEVMTTMDVVSTCWGTISATSTKPTVTAILISPLYIPATITVATMKINVTTALGSSGDIGIYNSAGNLVLNGGSGSLSTGTGLKSILPVQSNKTLYAGQYYIAITWNSTTGVVAGISYGVSNAIRYSGYISSGGGLVLPNTIPLTSTDITATQYVYWMALETTVSI